MKARFHGKTLYFARSEPETAAAVVWGLPWDCTCSYRRGARFGPQALREAFEAVESFSPYCLRDLEDVPVHDAGDMELPFGDTEKTLRLIRLRAGELAPAGRKLVTIGGEHLLSYPVIEHYHGLYGGGLHVLHVDAHCDLRGEYLGVRLSHATVAHLVTELVGAGNISHFFLRSGSRAEWRSLGKHPHSHFAASAGGTQTAGGADLGYLEGKKLYLSIDIDVFDPSLVPATSVPDAGGIFFDQFLRFLRLIEPFDIVGFDLMELACENGRCASAVAAAKILRETLLMVMLK
jgi:agmatinase